MLPPPFLAVACATLRQSSNAGDKAPVSIASHRRQHAVVGRRFYVIGGLPTPTSKAPSSAVWSLDLDAPKKGWHHEPDLPPPGLFVTATATDGTALFVLGGVGFDAEGKAVPAKSLYRLVSGEQQWARQVDLPEPRVGISSPCPQIASHRFFLIGGYAEVFPGAPREHPGFSAQPRRAPPHAGA